RRLCGQLGALLQPHAPRERAVRFEVPTAETTTAACDNALFGRPEHRTRPSRSFRLRHDWRHNDRLLSALAWWLARRVITVTGRDRGRYAAHLRPREPRTASRHDRAHSLSHGTRQRGVERRWRLRLRRYPASSRAPR